MSLPRSFLLAVVSTTATLALLTIGAPQVASAAAPRETAPPAVAQAGYTSKAWVAGAPGRATPVVVSPSGCIQYADYPHGSTSTGGRVNGKVRAVCRVTVPKMQHSAQLWETRWWGWDRIGINQPYSRAWSSFGRAMANDWCKNNTVRVTGNGYVIDRDLKTYTAATISSTIKNPCAL
jgi:hypothetical protein